MSGVSEAKEGHEEAVVIWERLNSLPSGLAEGSWRRCLGNRAALGRGRRKDRERRWLGRCEACLGKVQLSASWKQDLMTRVAKEARKWFDQPGTEV